MQRSPARTRLALLILAVLLAHGVLLRELARALATHDAALPARAAQVRTLAATLSAPAPVATAEATPPRVSSAQAAPRATSTHALRPRSTGLADAATARAPDSMPTAPASAVAAETLAQAPPAGAGLPLYRTRVPPSFALGYELRRGASRGSAELQWRLEGDRYEAQLDNHLAGRTATVWRSTGGFDDAGLAPARHTDQRQGRGSHAANFQREAGLVSFSGPRLEVPLPAGVQDRVSWLVQLAAIGAAEPALMSPGATISLFVVGARGDADVWTFTAIDTEVLELPGGPTPAVRLLREPARAWDTRVEVWLAPELHYLPVRARMGNGTESGSLELLLRELSLAR